jgi:hypothetical protein
MVDLQNDNAVEAFEAMALTWVAQQSGPPPEDQLRATLQALRAVFPSVSDGQIELVFDSVSKKASIQMDLGTIIHAETYEAWLDKRRGEIEWPQWKAYLQLLTQQGRPPRVLDSMSRSIDAILDHLGDPANGNAWARRGLVIGDVQSGKTSNYIGLMNKAADAGYRIFVVLTGNTESLRRQTQERIDEGMIGRDSAAGVLGPKANARADRGNRIGVGTLMEDVSHLASTTTVLADFNINAAKAQNVAPGHNLTIVFATKKNKKILERIAVWLRSHAGVDGKLDLPLLFIDDEADYASVDTSKDDDDPTAINQAIREILAISRRNSYVGFTATPFANIFINDEDDQDLFPRDFIYALDAPSNYMGATRLFGPSHGGQAEDGGLREIEDANDLIPLSHKKHVVIPQLPETAIEALRVFMVANAIRDLSGERDKPRSMLINVSRFNDVQERLLDLVADELAAYRNAIELHAATYARGVPNREISELEATFEREYADAGYPWEDILEALMPAVADIDVRVMNARRDRELEEQEKREGRVQRTIAIGGDLLSRGLTLEGLTVSYFYRRVAASDTLMQMGRWFGYRESYQDLCRTWLTPQTILDYSSTADSLLELRLELDRMRVEELTPKHYGLAVRSHPGTLLITARNKMRSAEAGKKSISLRGRTIEAATVWSNLKDLGNNESAAKRFVQKLTVDVGAPSAPRRNSTHQIWRGVPKESVAGFLSDFRSPSTLFEGTSLSDFVRTVPATDLQNWDVVLMGGRSEATFAAGPVVVRRPQRRVLVSDGVLLISEARRRVAGPRDIGLGLSKERLDEIADEYASISDEGATLSDRFIVPRLEHPVLLVYPIEGRIQTERPEDSGVASSEPFDHTIVSAVLAMPGHPSDKASDNVTYYLNAVAARYKEEFGELTVGDDDDDI